MSDENSTPEGEPLWGASRVSGTDDLMANTPRGVSMVDGDETDNEADFVPPRGRLGAAIALGASMSIDSSEGGVSKTFFPQIMNAFGLSDAELGLLNALGNAARMIFGPVWAMLADRFGRKPILLLGLLFNACISIPAYMLAAQATLPSAILGQSLLAIGMGLFAGPLGAALLELFPTKTRFSASAISYNLAYTIFGGTAPFLGAWLVIKTGSLLAPAGYMAIVSIVVFLVALRLPETSKRSMVDGDTA